MRMHFQERPWDLFLALGYVTAMAALILATGQGLLVAILMILLIPGYLLVAALFPGNGKIDWIERIALSLALSIVVVPVLGLILNFTPFGIRLVPIVLTLLAFSASMGLVAHTRRLKLPKDDRLSATINIRPPRWRESSSLEKALTVGLAAGILVSVSVLAFVVVTPGPGESFTEFYLLGPEGEADNYPTALNVAEEGSVILGVANHEFARVDYTIQVDFLGVDRVWNETGGFNDTVEVNRTSMGWINLSLDHDTLWTRPFSFRPESPGQWEIRFLLFRDGDLTAAYRNLHLFVTVLVR
jgi:uncharacterized membrane protein